ncbi:MAG: hypothetical protein GY742_09355 [Hyphomicrobiales bacterium]|nr:hypothetical protein [Hyphomicrobiales bacterium]
MPIIGGFFLAKGTTLCCEKLLDIEQFLQNQILLRVSGWTLNEIEKSNLFQTAIYRKCNQVEYLLKRIIQCRVLPCGKNKWQRTLLPD